MEKFSYNFHKFPTGKQVYFLKKSLKNLYNENLFTQKFKVRLCRDLRFVLGQKSCFGNLLITET